MDQQNVMLIKARKQIDMFRIVLKWSFKLWPVAALQVAACTGFLVPYLMFQMHFLQVPGTMHT